MTEVAGASSWAVSRRLLVGLTCVMLLFTTYGICFRAQDDVRRWQEERQILRLLKAIEIQQRRHYTASRTYASSLRTLNLELPPGIQASVFAGQMEGRPGFMAELCKSGRCWLITHRGEVLERQVVPPAYWPPALAEEADPAEEGTPGEERDHSTVARQPGQPQAEDRSGQGRLEPDGGAVARVVDVSQSRPGVRVVPRGPPTAFGLEPGAPLPGLSPTRDSEALWLHLEEERP